MKTAKPLQFAIPVAATSSMAHGASNTASYLESTALHYDDDPVRTPADKGDSRPMPSQLSSSHTILRFVMGPIACVVYAATGT